MEQPDAAVSRKFDGFTNGIDDPTQKTKRGAAGWSNDSKVGCKSDGPRCNSMKWYQDADEDKAVDAEVIYEPKRSGVGGWRCDRAVPSELDGVKVTLENFLAAGGERGKVAGRLEAQNAGREKRLPEGKCGFGFGGRNGSSVQSCRGPMPHK